MSKSEEEAKKKNIQSLRERLVTSDVNEHFTTDTRKWEETMKSGLQDPAKINALKKTLFLYGASGMEVTGPVMSGEEIKSHTRVASENKMPISQYFSGHMGRVYMSLPASSGQTTLDWIAGDNKNSAGEAVVYSRFAATHAGEVNSDGKVVEKKLSASQAFTTGMTSRTHYGMDVAMGGEGNRFLAAPDTTIKDDGTSGHVYYNLNKGNFGDSLGCGLEGTAPGKSGPLGAHSFVGAADEFGALEGAKYSIKFNPQNSQCKNFITTYLDQTPGIDPLAAEKLRKHYEHNSKPWYSRMFSSGNLSNQEFAAECQKVGIVFTDNGKQILTEFGKKCAEAGMVVRGMYNGATVNLSKDPEKLNQILQVKPEDIPNEIIYFKPQNSPETFLAQSEIFKDMENRPVLKNNPQLSYETCVAIGTMYNALQSSDVPDEKKQSIQKTLDLLSKENLKKYNIDINNFEIARDGEKILSRLGEHENSIADNIRLMQGVALEAQSKGSLTHERHADLQGRVNHAIQHDSRLQASVPEAKQFGNTQKNLGNELEGVIDTMKAAGARVVSGKSTPTPPPDIGPEKPHSKGIS